MWFGIRMAMIGLAVYLLLPQLYTRMAAEFQDLVTSGDYATWVAGGGRAVRPPPADPARPG